MNRTTPDETRQAMNLDAWLGILPFLAYGLVSISWHFGDTLSRPPIWLHPFLMFDAFVLLGLGAGLLMGFPRWAYSYLAWGVILSWWLSDMRIYGKYYFDSRMWLPLLSIFFLALLLRRSLSALRNLITGLWRDWTLFSLGIFTFYTWWGVMYDENHHPYLLIFIVASTLAACAGAWFYFYPLTAKRRILALLGGLVTILALSAINAATWDWRAYYNLPESTSQVNPFGVLFIVLVLALMTLTGTLTQKLQKSMSDHESGMD